jgi:integrase
MQYRLTDTTVKKAQPKPDGKADKLTDGGGLYLWVTRTGKYWRYDYTRPISKKRNTLVIGSYPEITLKEARQLHAEARALLARDIDPSEHKQAVQAAKKAMIENDFQSVALEWYDRFATDSEKAGNRNKRRLERLIFPYIGKRAISDIEPPEVLQCLRRIEHKGQLSTAHKVKSVLGQIFRYAVATGRVSRDPTTDLKGAIPPAKVKHFAAITNQTMIGKLLRDIDNYSGSLVTKTALKLSAYCFVRPSEIRRIEWIDVDMDKALWVIPAGKIKMRSDHLVPLSRQALELLEHMRPHSSHRRYIFPCQGNPKEAMSNNTVRQALRRMGYDKDTMTAHGFRAMASTSLYELGYDSELIERQLAHLVGNEVRRAYDRSQHIDKRTAMMQAWADYLDRLKAGAQVIPIHQKHEPKAG